MAIGAQKPSLEYKINERNAIIDRQTPGKPQTRHFNIANCQFSEAIFKVSRVWLEVGIDIIYEYFQCMKSFGLLYLAEKGYWYLEF